MKYLLGTIILICIFFTSCNKMTLQEENESSKTRLKASEVKAVLYGQSEGLWRAVYQGHEFFFKFTGSEGKVKLDSDFPQEEKTATATFSTKGRTVGLDFVGESHFAYLSSNNADEEFVISMLPDQSKLSEGVIFTGVNTGNTLKLLPATQEYIQSKVNIKLEFVGLMAKNLLDNSVITDVNGKFIAYYTMTLDYTTADYKIKVVTIENKNGNDPNGHTQVYESKLTKEGNVFKLNTPISSINATNGTHYSFQSVNCNDVLTVMGMSNVKIASNRTALASFDYTAGKKWSFCKAQNQGAASDEIWNLTAGNTNINGLANFQLLGLDIMDPGMSPNERPLIFWTSGFNTHKFIGSDAGATIRKTDELDRIYFVNSIPDGIRGSYGDEISPAQVNALKQHFKPLFDTWYNINGLYVIRVQLQNGSLRTYLLSPDVTLTAKGGSWIQCQ